MSSTPANVELKNLHKYYGTTPVVQDVSLKIDPGSFFSLLGPSGCGKTTTLRMIAGFIAPSSGAVLVRGQPVNGLPPYKRDMGMVFQNYALFPHLSIFRNVAFGLEVRGWDRQRIRSAVHDALSLVQLIGVEDRLPRQLSGGQQQRIALARALVINPSVLLLDEPLSNLDAKLRQEMRTEIKALQRRIGITTIFVTHDQEEALAMSDQVVVLNHGHVEQVGTPREIYESPATPFIARFMGNTNLVEVSIIGMERGLALARTADGIVLRCAAASGATAGKAAHLALRPEQLTLCDPDAPGALHGRVAAATYQGHSTLYEVEFGSATRLKILATRHDIAAGQPASMRYDATAAQLIVTPDDKEAIA